MQQQQSRQSYLDWLRMLAIIGVLFFHSAQPFAAENNWHIMNRETSNLFLEFTFFLSRFRMHLLFFISGAVTYFILQRKTGTQFVGLRFKRLMIPLMVGMLVVVPPQVYLERVSQGYTGNFFDFYPSIFSGDPYPHGNTSWHHLWFVAYLFVFDLVAAPLFVWLLSSRGKQFIQKMKWFSRGKRMYLLMLPSVIVYSALILKFPQTNDLIHDWAYLPYWFLFLITGFICIGNTQLMDAFERNRRSSLLIAFILMIFLNYLRWNHLEVDDVLPDWKTNPITYYYLAIHPVIAWAFIMALVGYGKKYLNKQHRALNYINEAVYPFYILHQTVIVILAFYVVQVNDTIVSKYMFILIATFGLSMGIFHLLIRPNKIMRFLFGMKEAKKEMPTTNIKIKQRIAMPETV